MLEAVNLSKRYSDGKLALDVLNLKINQGEIFCLLGANGAGKTTTINLFLNFIKPTKGKALIDGLDVCDQPLKSKDFISYIPENLILYESFTALQNLDFFARLGKKRKLDKKDYYNIFRKVGLQEEAFEKKISSFSKGMRQKVGLSIALVKDAPNILLDEPTSGLDPKATADFIRILKEIKSDGKTIFLCTHDIFRAKYLADSIGIMKDGRLVALNSKEEFLNKDLEKIYLDYMNDNN